MKNFLLLLAIVLTAYIRVPTASAQGNNPCWDVGRKTGGSILVDVPRAFTHNLDRNAVQCKLLVPYEAGTPIVGQRAILDYPGALDGLDIWTATRANGANFDIYDPPVRICFNAEANNLDVEKAVGPDESAAGEFGPTIMYSDARFTFADRLLNNAYLGPSRNFTQLEVVVDAERDYICADIAYPGAVLLLSSLPGGIDEDSPNHPNYQGDIPDRCLTPGSDDCID